MKEVVGLQLVMLMALEYRGVHNSIGCLVFTIVAGRWLLLGNGEETKKAVVYVYDVRLCKLGCGSFFFTSLPPHV